MDGPKDVVLDSQTQWGPTVCTFGSKDEVRVGRSIKVQMLYKEGHGDIDFGCLYDVLLFAKTKMFKTMAKILVWSSKLNLLKKGKFIL